MSKIPLVCLSLFGLSFSLNAQYDDLLKNPDISWVAEYTADFTLDPSLYSWYESDPGNELTVMHLMNPPALSGLCESHDLDQYFRQKMFAGLQEVGLLMFEDEDLEIPLSKEKLVERLSKVDSVAGPDPRTYDEVGFIMVRNDLTHENISFFRVRQVFYYDKTERKFGSRTLALAPMILKIDDEGNFMEHEPLAWLKIENPPKNWEKAEPQDFPYSIETKMKSNAPRFADFRLKKGRMDFLTLIVNEVAKSSHLILNKDFEPIDPTKLQAYVLSTDTVITRDPQTWEEKTEIVQRNAIKDVEQIGFVQQWFFDDRKRMFFNRVTAIAPLIAVKDEQGNFRYGKVLFYIINK